MTRHDEQSLIGTADNVNRQRRMPGGYRFHRRRIIASAGSDSGAPGLGACMVAAAIAEGWVSQLKAE
jgi:hypothetical protein